MIIAINSQLVNTKDIWKIGEIEFSKDSGAYFFTIYFFNGNNLTVHLFHFKFSDREIIVDGKRQYYHNNFKKSWIDEHYPELYPKIEEFRNQIVQIWSENQSEIPQFNL